MLMYKDNGKEIFDITVDDLVKKGIAQIWDYEDNLYIIVKSEDFYDVDVWVVNKKDNTVRLTGYIDFMLEIEDKAKPVNPDVLKGVS